ncbi:hypothetical protein IE53DRAFT_279738 [Violaceomyces palustris]|uniref:Uncharacterized protein n=1 Tax=Violaceomyces palustris TaxID=1673888 RepID=A0ACD0NME9_9BASI|nr:hypothetical protein IE53DRAFT_279738 [Violaceomyces palustris]
MLCQSGRVYVGWVSVFVKWKMKAGAIFVAVGFAGRNVRSRRYLLGLQGFDRDGPEDEEGRAGGSRRVENKSLTKDPW